MRCYLKRFADEERLQTQHKYPGYEAHKRLHEDFKKTVADLAAQVKAQGVTPTLLIKVNRNIGNWLINHIRKEDAKLAAYIRAQ